MNVNFPNDEELQEFWNGNFSNDSPTALLGRGWRKNLTEKISAQVDHHRIDWYGPMGEMEQMIVSRLNDHSDYTTGCLTYFLSVGTPYATWSESTINIRAGRMSNIPKFPQKSCCDCSVSMKNAAKAVNEILVYCGFLFLDKEQLKRKVRIDYGPEEHLPFSIKDIAKDERTVFDVLFWQDS